MFVVGDFDRDLWMYNMSVSKIEEVLGTNGVVIRILGMASFYLQIV
jgi:hypothetical protein